MISLCIDARMAFCSGIGTYIRQIVPLLTDFRITLFVDRVGADWCSGLDEILFPFPIYSIKEQIFFPKVIPHCDLFWSPNYNVPLLPIRAKKRVVTIHDACHLALGTFAQKAYAKFVMGRALRSSDRAITDSKFSKDEIRRFHGDFDLEVVPIATNRDHYFRRGDSEEIRKKYRLPAQFVLFVGNHMPHKNLDGLMSAFSKVKVPGLELVMVGKGTRIGMVLDEELPFLYSMAEAFVLPSFYEGFGLPPLEAMGCGCPTIVSKAASLPEVCGDASFYFNPRDIDEMAAAITKVVTDDRLKNELVQKGYERVKTFSWKRAAERHRQIFEEAVQSSNLQTSSR